MLSCTTCGTPTSREGQKFCTTCGAPVDDYRETETPAPATGTLPSSPDAPPPGPVPPASPWAGEPPTIAAPPFAGQPFAGQPFAGQPRAGEAPAGLPPAGLPPAGPPTAGLPRTEGLPPTAGLPPTGPPPAWPPTTAGLPPTGTPPPGRTGGRTPTWIAIAAAVVLVLAGGGVAAWKLLGHHTTAHHPTAGSSTGSANQAAPGSPGSPAANSPTPATPSTTPSPSPSPSVPGGPFTVATGPGVAQQSSLPQVVSFLRSYFTAINNHDYGSFAPDWVSSQRPTPAQFQAGYGSTADSAATLTALSPTADGVAATVKFTSHQVPSASPTGTRCTAWRITLFLRARGSGYQIGAPPPGYRSRFRAC